MIEDRADLRRGPHKRDVWLRRLLLGVTLLLLLGVGLAFTFAGATGRKDNVEWTQYFQSLGAGLIASVIVYLIISILFEPFRSQLQFERVAEYATKSAYEQFQTHFARALPSAVYPASQGPRGEFRDAFVTLVRQSTRYEIKGTTAVFASVRLAEFAEHHTDHHLDTIRLYLLDPREERLAKAHARLRLHHSPADDDAIVKAMAEVRAETFVTLVGLFDIRTVLPTWVYFHMDLPFFRAELFDQALLLSYYSEPIPFPETLHFESTTRSFAAYSGAIKQTRLSSTKVLSFGQGGDRDITSETELSAVLTELGCTKDVATLRGEFAERRRSVRKQLSDAGISPGELF